MKKTLVAVAALAASAAFAQSSVTLYGVADAYFGSQKVNTFTGTPPVGAATNGVSQTVVNSGGLSQSRLGVSVKEDLGAGLSAFAVIEQGISLDDGKSAGARKSVVGLSGGFGAVSLGNQLTPLHDAVEGTIDAQGNSAFSAVGASSGRDASQAQYAHAYTNSVRYDSPNFDGFSGAVQVGFGEDKTTGASAGRNVALNLTYANGPVAVAFAYANEKAAGVNVKADKTTVVGGSYDFGVAKLNLGYEQVKDGNTERTYNVGVAVPVDAFTFVGQFAQTKEKGTDGNSKSFGLEGRYALSKRTTAYVGYNNTRDSIGLASAVKSNRFGVGMRHVF